MLFQDHNRSWTGTNGYCETIIPSHIFRFRSNYSKNFNLHTRWNNKKKKERKKERKKEKRKKERKKENSIELL
jgi:hypothetical protein